VHHTSSTRILPNDITKTSRRWSTLSWIVLVPLPTAGYSASSTFAWSLTIFIWTTLGAHLYMPPQDRPMILVPYCGLHSTNWSTTQMKQSPFLLAARNDVVIGLEPANMLVAPWHSKSSRTRLWRSFTAPISAQQLIQLPRISRLTPWMLIPMFLRWLSQLLNKVFVTPSLHCQIKGRRLLMDTFYLVPHHHCFKVLVDKKPSINLGGNSDVDHMSL